MTKSRHIFALLMLASAMLLRAADDKMEYRLTHYDDHNGMSQWHTTKILQDNKGFMWFATWNGLNRYDGYEFAVFKSKPGDGNNLTSDRIRNMLMGDDGNIYCGINTHIWRFNLKTYQFEMPDAATQERYRARIGSDTSVKSPVRAVVNGFDIDGVRQLFVDAQKNTWVMTNYGVEKITPAPKTVYPLELIPNDIIRCMYRDNKKRIWVTSRNTGVVTVLDSVANLIGYLGRDGRLHRERVSFGPVYCVFQQKNSTIWFGSKPEGLYRVTEVSNGVFTFENFAEGNANEVKNGTALNANAVYDIKEDRKGRLWIATHGGGVNLVEKPMEKELRFCNMSNVFKQHPKDSYNVRRLLIVGDSVLLATTTEGFLVVRDIKGAAKNVKFNLHMRESDRAKSLSCSAVMDMLIDRKGRLFIATESGGVNMLLTKDLLAKQFDFAHFTTDNGMGSDVALAMKEIGDEIIVQCNNQVTRLNVDTDTKENFNARFFTFAARFSDAEPLLLDDGRWMLSLESGVIALPEQAFHQHSYVPRIVLTSIAVPEKTTVYNVDNLDTLVLESSERDVTITYAALDYYDNSNIKYITRFTGESAWNDGSDSENWTTPRDHRVTSLYNLSPGTYVLEIRSTNAEGLLVQNIRKLTIIVKPAFYETSVAYIIYIILLVLLISGITYTVTYIRNLKRQREENLQAYLKLLETSPAAMTETEGQTKDADEENDNAPVGEPQHEAHVISHLTEEDDAFMRRLMSFVEENLGDSNIGVDEMASATATSRSSLNRKMKTILGVTPADFLKEARMKKACQMLENTYKGVTDIAYACGFSDPKYFSKCFKASVGMSPSDYRNKTRE